MNKKYYITLFFAKIIFSGEKNNFKFEEPNKLSYGFSKEYFTTEKSNNEYKNLIFSDDFRKLNKKDENIIYTFDKIYENRLEERNQFNKNIAAFEKKENKTIENVYWLFAECGYCELGDVWHFCNILPLIKKNSSAKRKSILCFSHENEPLLVEALNNITETTKSINDFLDQQKLN